MKGLLIFSILLWHLSARCQQNDLDFVIEKVRTDYPAFAEKMAGRNFDELCRKIADQNRSDTFKAMALITRLFEDRHLDLFRVKQPVDTDQCKADLKMITHYLDKVPNRKHFEGYWITETQHCIIGLKQSAKGVDGYVIKAPENSAVYPGMKLLDMNKETDSRYYTRLTTIRMATECYLNSFFRNDSILTTGPYYKWRLLKNARSTELPRIKPLEDQATGSWLNDKTFLVTIPVSTAQNGKVLDSLIASLPDLTTKCDHLIIDVRSNTGGSALAYEPLYKLMYTNPIERVNSSVYATLDESKHKQSQLDEYIAKKGTDSGYISALKYWIVLHRDSVGRFVKFAPDSIIQNTVYTSPKKVSIITNFGCQSACEIFLLNAKQSRKVKLFGENTMGAIDHLDFYPQTSPSGNYKLYIATTRRNIPPGGSKLDGKGIDPDVRIDDSVTNWVDFVNHYYEKP